MRVDQCRAGARAAGQGQPGATFPHPQRQPVRRQHLHEADIGPVGKQLVALQHRPDGGDRHARQIRHEERHMRVAHAARRGSGERTSRQIQMTAEIQIKRVHLARQRHVGPTQPRRAHIDAHLSIGENFGRQIARHGADHQPVAPALGGQQMRDTAGRVAAGAGLPAIWVANAHERVRARPFRQRLDDDQLVAAHAGPPVRDPRRARRREIQRRHPLIEHDEIVPAAMHLGETRDHRGAYMAGPAEGQSL